MAAPDTCMNKIRHGGAVTLEVKVESSQSLTEAFWVNRTGL